MSQVSCDKVTAHLADYLDGSLDEPTRVACHQHLQRCAPCQAFFESYAKATCLCKKALLRSAPGEFAERLKINLRMQVTRWQSTRRR